MGNEPSKNDWEGKTISNDKDENPVCGLGGQVPDCQTAPSTQPAPEKKAEAAPAAAAAPAKVEKPKKKWYQFW